MNNFYDPIYDYFDLSDKVSKADLKEILNDRGTPDHEFIKFKNYEDIRHLLTGYVRIV